MGLIYASHEVNGKVINWCLGDEEEIQQKINEFAIALMLEHGFSKVSINGDGNFEILNYKSIRKIELFDDVQNVCDKIEAAFGNQETNSSMRFSGR